MKLISFINNIIYYFLGTFATKILQILFVPLYTKYIDAKAYGKYSLVLSYVSLIVPLLYQSIWEGVLRFIIEKEDKKYSILSTTTTYCAGLTILYCVIYLLVAYYSGWDYSLYILLMALGQMGTYYWQFSARALRENKIYSIAAVVNSGIFILFNFVLIVFLKMGLEALFIANISGNFTMIVIIELKIHCIRNIKIKKFDHTILKSILKYSIPLCINAASWWLIDTCNNLVIFYNIGIAENGVYAVASKFGSILAIVTTVINMAWLEEAFRTARDEDSSFYFWRVFNALVRLLLSGIIVLIPLTYIYYQYCVFGEYKEGVSFTSIIYVNAGFSAMASHLGSAFLARKKSSIMFWTTLIGGIISSIGGYFLSIYVGVFGVIITTLFGYIIMCVIRTMLMNKFMKIYINIYIIVYLLFIIMAIAIGCNVAENSLIGQLIILAISILIFLFINRMLIKTIFCKIKNKIRFLK